MTSENMNQHFVTEAQMAERLCVSGRTLQRWRRDGGGPPYFRIGPRRIGYRERDVQAWVAVRIYPHRAAEMACAQR